MMAGNRKHGRATAGESLIEALISVLVIGIALIGLASAVSSAARVNAMLSNDDVGLKLERLDSASGEPATVEVVIANASGSSTSHDVLLHHTRSGEGDDGFEGYYYYDDAPETP